ncbi:MAG TPA: M67 family metallopeptidase [Bacillota bacterium]|jgi:proteasome lid subunit RPN8/RPN11
MREIIVHCLDERPNEACGLLVGLGGRVTRVCKVRNVEGSPFDYRVDPEDQFRVMQEMERDGLELTAIYHSHPTSDARPSPKDVRLAYYPEAFQVIVSLRGEPAVRAFHIVDGRVEEASLIVEGSPENGPR